MNVRIRQLATLVHELNLSPALPDARSRRVFHAAVYLAEQLGLSLGYDFGWHESGPYSAALTADLYDLAVGPSNTLPYELNTEFSKRTKRVRALLRVPSEVQLDASRWLMLLAAMQYLMKQPDVDDLSRRLEIIDSALPSYAEYATHALEAA